jgi:hypothetical protein
MADIPVPGGGVQHGVVQAPNETNRGDHRANAYLPLGGAGSPVSPPNEARPGDHRAGSRPLGGMASPITLPNHRFAVGMTKMPQPESAETPGKGAVPVNPVAGGVLPLSNKRAK